MKRIRCPSLIFHLACLLVCINAMAPIAAAQGPLASVENVALNPSNFVVSVRITNTVSGRYFCLIAYDGPPVGVSTAAPRTRVSDSLEGTVNSIVLIDLSAPLSYSGRT